MIKETEDTVYYINEGGTPLDKSIKPYLDKINEFEFVQTRLSCQGHFTKKLHTAPVYYGKRDAFEGASSWYGRVTTSRIKPPFVIIEFWDTHFRSAFMKWFIKRRRYFYKKDIQLHIITPKNGYPDYFSAQSLIISKFNERFVSVSLFLGRLKHWKYHKNKIKVNKYLKTIRGFMFRKILNALEDLL